MRVRRGRRLRVLERDAALLPRLHEGAVPGQRLAHTQRGRVGTQLVDYKEEEGGVLRVPFRLPLRPRLVHVQAVAELPPRVVRRDVVVGAAAAADGEVAADAAAEEEAAGADGHRVDEGRLRQRRNDVGAAADDDHDAAAAADHGGRGVRLGREGVAQGGTEARRTATRRRRRPDRSTAAAAEQTAVVPPAQGPYRHSRRPAESSEDVTMVTCVINYDKTCFTRTPHCAFSGCEHHKVFIHF